MVIFFSIIFLISIGYLGGSCYPGSKKNYLIFVTPSDGEKEPVSIFV